MIPAMWRCSKKGGPSGRGRRFLLQIRRNTDRSLSLLSQILVLDKTWSQRAGPLFCHKHVHVRACSQVTFCPLETSPRVHMSASASAGQRGDTGKATERLPVSHVFPQRCHFLLAQEPQLGPRSERALREAEVALWRMTSKPILG